MWAGEAGTGKASVDEMLLRRRTVTVPARKGAR
jgi:hypothetical protein